jgi:predicted double-glycine peptidase
MVVVIAFAILTALTAEFYPIKDQPKTEINLSLGAGSEGRLRPGVKPASAIEKNHFIKQRYDYSCGSAALATLLDFSLGEKLSERQVIQGLLEYGDSARIQRRRAFSLLDMKKFVTVLGYQGRGYRADLDDLKTLKTPCIVPIKIFKYRHFAVFRGVAQGHVFLTDPWRGDISFTLDEFKQRWYRHVLFMVSRKGEKPFGPLQLTEKDLRFIDEDATRELLTVPTPAVTDREERLIRNVPGKYQYYRP